MVRSSQICVSFDLQSATDNVWCIPTGFTCRGFWMLAKLAAPDFDRRARGITVFYTALKLIPKRCWCLQFRPHGRHQVRPFDFTITTSFNGAHKWRTCDKASITITSPSDMTSRTILRYLEGIPVAFSKIYEICIYTESFIEIKLNFTYRKFISV